MGNSTTTTIYLNQCNRCVSAICCSVFLFILSMILFGMGGKMIASSKISDDDSFNDTMQRRRTMGIILIIAGFIFLLIDTRCWRSVGAKAHNRRMSFTVTLQTPRESASISPNPRSTDAQLTRGSESSSQIPTALNVDLGESPCRTAQSDESQPTRTTEECQVSFDQHPPSYDEAITKYPVLMWGLVFEIALK